MVEVYLDSAFENFFLLFKALIGSIVAGSNYDFNLSIQLFRVHDIERLHFTVFLRTLIDKIKCLISFVNIDRQSSSA